ncbi:transcription termination factor 5, mitochondrial [Halyomorpha halys]|uniref:transcription termination factor 5, mitochondrial n=1 Tax=Halyomorpha halys TaxID=286706 RepID=UPI0006D4CD1F|nr:transcription termination factor 5, mitochondrial [Halyomorpha halys]
MRRIFLLPMHHLNKRLFCNNVSILPEPNAKFQFKHVDMIKEFTGLPIDQVRRAVSSKLELQLLSEREVLYKLELLQAMDLYDFKSINIIPLLLKHHLVLKNYHEALCEYSFTPFLIQSFQIKKFYFMTRTSVKDLKEKGYIEYNANVIRNLWRHAELDISNCPEISESHCLRDLKVVAIRAYLKEKLGVSDRDIDKSQLSEINFRFMNKSFRTMNTNLKIFRDDIMLSKARIFLNWFVLHSNYDNSLEILSKFPHIGSTDMKICFHIYPKISMMPVENMEKILKYLKDEDIPIIALEKYPVLLTLNCETVKQRLKEMKSNEVFSIYQKHPAVAKLLHHQVKAKRRLNILQELKILCTINFLLTNEKIFQRICENNHKVFGYDSLFYLKSELNLDKSEIIFKLNRHKRWRFVPVVEVGKNLRYLRKRFSDREIIDNIYILFYYNMRVKQELEKLEHFQLSDDFMCNGRIKRDFILPLSIYFLEKDFNFTGESVWETSTINPYQDLPDRPEIKINSS